jgi:chitin disaccharide deacetylase
MMNSINPPLQGAERCGTSAIELIVNADDFGLSQAINEGIADAHENGIVTSVSVMVRGAAAEHAARYLRQHPGLDAGLHVDLGEWFVDDDQWKARYEVVPLDDEASIDAEVSRQIVQFIGLIGSPPSHLDSHQHVHQREPLRTILLKQAFRLGVPLRHFCSEIRYCGDFHGQDDRGVAFPDSISAEALIILLNGLPPGITELACHPGRVDRLETTYLSERAIEVSTLCDPRIRDTLRRLRISLRSFASAGARQSRSASGTAHELCETWSSV